MHNDQLITERWRLFLVLMSAFAGGMISGYWLISFTLSLIGYIAWLLYKVRQLNRWLASGSKQRSIPDSDGIWESIYQQIQNTRRTSAKRKKRTSKLLKRFQGIITSLPYATVVLNDRNEIDWSNKLAVKILGVNIKTDRGQRFENLIRIPEIQSILSKSRHQEMEISLPGRPEEKISIQMIPVKSDLKLVIARDITEMVNIHRMRKYFIANASHELRTPLTVIAGYLEILNEDETLTDDLHAALNSATEQTVRMQSIIEDLLTLSNLEQTQLKEDDIRKVDVPSILSGICNDEVLLIQKGSHKVSMDIDTDLKISGVNDELVSVCSNLIHNAIRHTIDGTTVEIVWKKIHSGDACLIVKDDGQGIAAKHIPFLTKRFYRVDEARSRDKGGTGLGLAIVQHIIQRHGGTMDIKSNVGKGSRFTVCFPESRVIS